MWETEQGWIPAQSPWRLQKPTGAPGPHPGSAPSWAGLGAPALMEPGPTCKLSLLVCDLRGHLTSATLEEYTENYRGLVAFLSMGGELKVGETHLPGVEIQPSAIKSSVALGEFLLCPEPWIPHLSTGVLPSAQSSEHCRRAAWGQIVGASTFRATMSTY